MSTQTLTPAARLTPRHVHAAERLRLTGLRSTGWLTLSIAASLLGIGVVAAIGVVAGALQAGPDVDPVGGVLAGAGVAEFLVAGLGVLAVTGEYASGVIRSTFTAVPARSGVVAARAAVVLELVLVVVTVSIAAGYVVVRVLLGAAGTQLSLGGGAGRALVGTVLHLGLLAVLGTAIGWLVRSTAGGIAVFLVVAHGLSLIAILLPGGLGAAVLPWLPVEAGRAATAVLPQDGALPPWGGLAVLAAWTLAALAAAAVVTRRRDA